MMKSPLNARILSVPLFIFTLLSLAQEKNPYLELPDKVPLSCELPLSGLVRLSKAQETRRLQFQLKSLELAENGVEAMAKGLADSKSERSPALTVADLFQGTRISHDALACAALVMSKYMPVDDDDETTRTLLIIAYNQEADAIAQLDAHTKEQLGRPASEQSQSTILSDAKRIDAMTQLQQEAAETLMQVSTLSLLMSIDTSDPNAINTKKTTISCSDYADLKQRSTNISKRTKSAYTDTASLYLRFFQGHMCK